MPKRNFAVTVIGLTLTVLTGCTVHPQGERAERQAALAEGKVYEPPRDHSAVSPLPDRPSSEDLVRFALQNNGDVEKAYWEWRSAIEQIPQDGTQPTNLALSLGTVLNNGSFSRERTTISAFNDPMADIVWPEKLTVAAQRALEAARAAGQRFQKAKLDLRAKVLDAYYDYVLNANLIRLEESNAALLATTANTLAARNQTGNGGQLDLLKARNELDLARNDIASMKSQTPALLAALNATLNRKIREPIQLSATPEPDRTIVEDDAALLAMAAERNPELSAIARDIAANGQSIRLAKLQYHPDFSLSAGTDLAGVSQSLSGMLTVPLLRYEAINAAVTQAEANLRATESARRQLSGDLAARVILNITLTRDANRQLVLLRQTILPRAKQAVDVARSSYEAGQTSLLDLLDSQRSLIALERLIANLTAVEQKHIAALETDIAVETGAPTSSSPSFR